MDAYPLHPAIVHLPLGLIFALPFVSLIIVIMFKNHDLAKRSWLVVIFLLGLTSLGTFMSIKTGEREEEIVERVVPKNAIHEHEEKAEALLWAVLIVLALAVGAYFVSSSVYSLYAQYFVTFLLFGLLIFAIQVGKSGGELVYLHKAPNAYQLTK